MSKLSSYLKDRLEAWIQVEGFPGWEVKLAYLSREELNKIRIAATRTSFNNRARIKEETLDQDLFVDTYVKATVLDWKGFTLKIAGQLMPVVFPPGTDENTVVDFSQEEAITLAKNSVFFDSWLNDMVFDLDSFRTGRGGSQPGDTQ